MWRPIYVVIQSVAQDEVYGKTNGKGDKADAAEARVKTV